MCNNKETEKEKLERELHEKYYSTKIDKKELNSIDDVYPDNQHFRNLLKDKILKHSIVILPATIDTDNTCDYAKSATYLLDNLKKELNVKGINISVDKLEQSKLINLRKNANIIFLPTLYFIHDILTNSDVRDVIIGLISGYIYDSIKSINNKTTNNETIIEVKLFVEEGKGKIKEIYFRGTLEELKKLLDFLNK